MSEFKFDDEIEASDNSDFKGYITCRFLADKRDSSNCAELFKQFNIVALDRYGTIVLFEYARPATPKILIDGIQYSCTKMQAARIAEIKKELEVQHKIITGEA
tara:strand:+ start:168 stop:476 length:309 start_codon:yes stop_codon:yes gene_type:complete